jgi:hypothetical protein
MKYLLLFLLVGCATVESKRLPEAKDKVTVPQWKEYCLRNEWVDPACEVK